MLSGGRRKYKVVMLGEGRVGKTSLLQRFLTQSFDEGQKSTVKATMYASTKMQVDGKFVDIAIWDTAGQEKYNALGPIYYRDAQGAVLVYDITDKESFSKVRGWLRELRQARGDNVSVVVVGNKIDLERERKISTAEADAWCAEHQCLHFQCSAKLGLKVSEAFKAMAKAVVDCDERQMMMAAGGGGEGGDLGMMDSLYGGTSGGGGGRSGLPALGPGGNNNTYSNNNNGNNGSKTAPPRRGIRIKLDEYSNGGGGGGGTPYQSLDPNDNGEDRRGYNNNNNTTNNNNRQPKKGCCK